MASERVQLSLRVPPSVDDWYTARAARLGTGISKNTVLTWALQEYMERIDNPDGKPVRNPHSREEG